MIIDTNRLGGEVFDLEAQTVEFRELLLRQFIEHYTKEKNLRSDLHLQESPNTAQPQNQTNDSSYLEKQAV